MEVELSYEPSCPSVGRWRDILSVSQGVSQCGCMQWVRERLRRIEMLYILKKGDGPYTLHEVIVLFLLLLD